MYNFRNLNDYEFELLCKDVMGKKMGIPLRVYKSGRDSGVDISCFKFQENIIQVKHYRSSKFSDLIFSLKKELKKVQVLSPKNYYICTSLELTPNNLKDIFEMFSDYMDSYENIVAGTVINEFLRNENNIDIVKKNYKLIVILDYDDLIKIFRIYRKLFSQFLVES